MAPGGRAPPRTRTWSPGPESGLHREIRLFTAQHICLPSASRPPAVTLCRSLRGPCGTIADITAVTPSPDRPARGPQRPPAHHLGGQRGLG